MEKIKIQGMSCQHCVMSVTKALGSLPGVKNLKWIWSRGGVLREHSECGPGKHPQSGGGRRLHRDG